MSSADLITLMSAVAATIACALNLVAIPCCRGITLRSRPALVFTGGTAAVYAVGLWGVIFHWWALYTYFNAFRTAGPIVYLTVWSFLSMIVIGARWHEDRIDTTKPKADA